MTRSIVFAGGGTAGHVVPALAVVERLTDAGVPATDIEFRGATRGIEARLLGDSPYQLTLLPGRGIKRSFTPSALWWNSRAVWEFGVAKIRTLRDFRNDRPSCVVVIGGYAAASAAIAAVFLRIPLIVIQVDAHPGVVNRFAARFAKYVAVPQADVAMPHAHTTGVPVRKEISPTADDTTARKTARAALGVVTDKKTIVGMGGSLGARTINTAISGVAELWNGRDDVQMVLIGGLRQSDEITTKSDVLIVRDYIDDMANLYQAADVIVSRGGANSVAEIGVAGVPAIFVPLPSAPADHQRKNAQPLVDAGGAVMLSDSECTPEMLAPLLDSLLEPERQSKMRTALQMFSEGDAAQTIAQKIGEYR